MNPFYIRWILLFATGCIDHSEPSKLTLNIDSGNWTQSQTHWPTHEIKHIWAIKQFSLHEKFNTSEISSPMLHASTTDKYEWYVRIIPNYIVEGNETFCLWIHLSDGSTVRKVNAGFNVSIINEKKEVLLERTPKPDTRDFTAGRFGKVRGWYNFCKKDDFFRNQLLQNDTLTLFIYIRWISEFSNDAPHQLEIISSSNPTPEATTKKSNLSENLESMLENPKFADVFFITNGSSYPAHKNILASKSPIFSAMFQRKDSKNGKSKKIRINVTHMDEKVLRAMLRYIYTGKCELLGELTNKLFEAAKKYGLYGLRETCQQTSFG